MAVPRVRERLQRVQKEHTNDYMPNDSLLYSVDSCLPNPASFFVTWQIQPQLSVLHMDIS